MICQGVDYVAPPQGLILICQGVEYVPTPGLCRYDILKDDLCAILNHFFAESSSIVIKLIVLLFAYNPFINIIL